MNIMYKCEKCGGKLIERLPNGVWHFCFGKQQGAKYPPVEIYAYGSIKIRCWRRNCYHLNTLTYFPGLDFPKSNQPETPTVEQEVEEDGV